MQHHRAAGSVTTDNKHKRKDTTSQRFPRENRLLDAGAFDGVFRNGTRSRDTMFIVLCRHNCGKPARLGLAVSKKSCRLAVGRNRLKRIIRESFRLHKERLHGLDVVVMSQAAATGATNRELFDSLSEHWQRCRKTNRTRTEQKEA